MQVGLWSTFFNKLVFLKMDLGTRIQSLIEPALDHLGYSIVEVLLNGSKRLTLDIKIERLDGVPVSIDDCVRASREISALLDVEDPIEGSYVLEVSSPGFDRPLVKPKDFQRFIGETVKLKTHEFLGNRKQFKGLLKSADHEKIILALEQEENTISLRYDQIHRAKLSPKF